MSMYISGINTEEILKEEREKEFKRRKLKEEALEEIVSYYIKLNKDEKEGLKRLIQDKGKEIRREKLINKRNEINKELKDTPPYFEEFTKYKEDYELVNNLHKHVCKEFQRITNELLGEDYYNTGMDYYTCTTMIADDIIRKYGKKRGRKECC